MVELEGEEEETEPGATEAEDTEVGEETEEEEEVMVEVVVEEVEVELCGLALSSDVWLSVLEEIALLRVGVPPRRSYNEHTIVAHKVPSPFRRCCARLAGVQGVAHRRGDASERAHLEGLVRAPLAFGRAAGVAVRPPRSVEDALAAPRSVRNEARRRLHGARRVREGVHQG